MKNNLVWVLIEYLNLVRNFAEKLLHGLILVKFNNL